jgi:hypothetical protein
MYLFIANTNLLFTVLMNTTDRPNALDRNYFPCFSLNISRINIFKMNAIDPKEAHVLSIHPSCVRRIFIEKFYEVTFELLRLSE